MKILRVTYGLTNNFADAQVPDEFNLLTWIAAVKGDGGVTMERLWIPIMWVQHVMVLTPAEATDTLTRGMSKQ